MTATTTPSGTQRARLFVDGVGAPITANITDRHRAGMVVRQPLPFLRLDTHVTDADGQRARISHVRIAMHQGVPSIELELENLADERSEAEPVFVPGISQHPPRGDETLPYGGPSLASRQVVVGPPSTELPREPTLTGIGRPSIYPAPDPLADTLPAVRPAGSLPVRAVAPQASLVDRVWTALRRLVRLVFGRPLVALPRA